MKETIHRYVVIVDGVDRWLHDSIRTRDELLQMWPLDDGTCALARVTASGKHEWYALLKFACDIRVLTWNEHVASSSDKPVKGLEPWCDAAAPLVIERDEQPYDARAPLPLADRPFGEDGPVVGVDRAAGPDKTVEVVFHDAGKVIRRAAYAPRAEGEKYSDVALRLLKAEPFCEIKRLSSMLYGDATPVNITRTYATLTYLKKQKKVEKVAQGYKAVI